MRAGVASESRTATGQEQRSEPSFRLIRLALLLLPVIIFIVGAWQYRWMSDDGFINLRIVSELRAGHGPVFNTGERVEAFTSPLWLLVLFVGDLLTPLRPEYVAVIFGIILAVAGLVLAILGAVRLHPDCGTKRFWFPAGALVLAVLAPMWKFASSGLETGLTFAWLGGCLVVLANWSRNSRRFSVWAAILVGVGPLVRPEFLLLSLGFVGVVLLDEWGSRGWRSRLGLLGAAFALPFTYQIFRMGYFASLVPNSALAKEATGSHWSAGWTYLRATFVDSYGLWIALLILAVAAYGPFVVQLRRRAQRRETLVIAAFVIGGIVQGLYIVRVGGDFMHARLLLPALFLVVAPVAAVPLTRRFVGALLVTPWVLVALVGLRSVDDQPRALGPNTTNAITLEDFGMGAGGPQRAWFSGPGVYYFETRLPGLPSGPTTAVATYGIGVTGYALGPNTYVLDLLGLGDAFTSHLKLARRGTVAHEKPLPIPWIPARLLRPGVQLHEQDFVGPARLFALPLDDPRGEPFAKRVADARRVLHCPRMVEFLGTYEGPLGPGRFFDNLRDSFLNFGFRIPPEPREAQAALCPR
jgi:arabinofuranosyltransferase